MRRPSQSRSGERGFALLFVFALAGITALMLYNELPRAVFESQRAKEDLLVSRGQEYQRGIQLYYRKFRKYPATMEELEKSSGIRFLRRRYVDPFSGKDDWRLVHVGANGQFTDSKVIKPQQPAQSTGFGANSTTAAEAPKEDPNDPALKKRASDTSAVEIGGNAAPVAVDPNNPNAPPGVPPPAIAVPGANPYPGRTGSPVTYPQQQPVGGYGGVGSVGSVGSMGSVGGVGSSGGVGTGGVGTGGVGTVGAGLPNTNYPSSGINSQNGGAMPVQIPGTIPGYQQTQSGQRPITPEQLNPALDVIQRLLTQPRQPPPGVIQGGQAPTGPMTNPSGTFMTSGPAANGGNGQFGGGGIAGVASKHEGKGIKIVNERDRIEEWEFIYDYGKERGGRPGTNSQSQQNPANINPAQGMGMGQSGFGGQQQGSGGFGAQQGGGFGGGMGGGMGGGFGGQQGGNQQPRPTTRPR